VETTATVVRAEPRAREGASRPEDGWQERGRERWAGLSELEPGLRRLLSTRCLDENDVDDVIQETYVRAARYRKASADQSSLRAWTARIALNVLSDVRRRAGRSQALPSLEDGEEADVPEALVHEPPEDVDVRLGSTELPEEDALALLERALAELRDDDRLLLDGYYRQALDVPACARRLDVPARLVKVRLYRARQRLLVKTERLLVRRRTDGLLGVRA